MNYSKQQAAEELLNLSLSSLEGAYAQNTLRAYRADFITFISWCGLNDENALPASPEAVAKFVSADAEQSQSATIRRRVAAIGRIHRLNRFTDPTKDEDVVLAMRRMHRSKGRRQKQALGLTADLIEKMFAVAGDDVKGVRDRALLLLAYDTMRRRSELVGFLIEDLSIKPDGTGSVWLRFSKTDQEGEGKKLPLSKETVDACRTWLEKVQEDTGPILRKVSRHGTIGSQLNGNSVSSIYKYLARKAGLPEETVREISGHSTRVGAAQDMLINGRTLAQIMNKGGWKKPETVARYVEMTDMSDL